MRPIHRILLAIGAAALASAGYLSVPLSPQIDAPAFLEKGGHYQVRIRRDTYGVPYIFGERDADVAFGLAYAHAEDDFEMIQTVYLATRGKLATIKGADAAPGDYLVALLRVWPTIDGKYEAETSSAAKALAEGYADGLNYYAARHPDQVFPGLFPIKGKDVAAGFVFKAPLFFGLDKVLKDLFAGKKAGPLRVDGRGSNGFALAPSRTADHSTRLVVNSHQPYSGPVSWYEARLFSPQGLDIAGGTFPGGPLILHGHNRWLGWASTVNLPDLADVYRLVLHPEDPGLYQLDGAWKRFEVETVTLEVKLFGRLIWPVKRELLFSAHGPVMRTEQGTFAVRYAGMGEVRHLEQFYRLNHARSFEQWQDAMRLQALPSINYVYADHQGNVGLFYNARLPIRVEGIDFSGTVPGDRSDLIWDQFLPFDQAPRVFRPESGFVFSSNHSPFFVTDGPDNPRPESFSKTFGLETYHTNRSLRALELFSADPQITREELEVYKYDHNYSEKSQTWQLVQELLTLDVHGEPLLVEAKEVLARWDRSAASGNRSAAIAILSTEPILDRRRARDEPLDPLTSFSACARQLKKSFGRLDPEWGEVNRLRRGRIDLPLSGGPDTLRAVHAGPPGEDGRLTAMLGDTYIMFVEWDASGRVSSRSVHQFGTATVDAASPHYADQAPLFAAEKTKPIYFEEAELLKNLEREYRPQD